MAGFCKKCGAQLGDGAGFCIACGTKIEEQPEAALPVQPDQNNEPPLQAPPPVPPPPVTESQTPLPGTESQTPPPGTESQTPQPPAYQIPPSGPGYQTPPPPGYGQPGQPQAPAYGAQPKKKGLPKLLLIAIIIAAIVVALILILPNVVSGQGNRDFFKLGADQVPSVKLILGEKREVNGLSKSTSNGVQEMVIGYKVDENQNKEMEKYTKALMDEYGYINTSPYNFTGPTGSDFQFAKESEEEGYIVIVKVDYDSEGYTLTLTRGKGALTINEEPEPVEPEPEPAKPDEPEPDEPAVPAADMVDIIINMYLVDYDTEAEAIARLKEEGIEAFNNNDGSYTYRMTKEKQQELKDYSKIFTTEFLEGMKDEGIFPGVLDVEYNEDFSSIKIICNDTLINGDEKIKVIFYCGIWGPMYQVYDGKGLDAKTVIVLYNSDRGTTSDEFISPDIFG